MRVRVSLPTTILAIVSLHLVACVSPATSSDGGGGTGGQGGETSSVSSTGGAGGGAGGGGEVVCQEIHLGKLRASASSYFESEIVENVDGPGPDVLSISFWASPTVSTWTGVQDLASPDNSNFETCTSCINVYTDDYTGSVYFQSAGTFDLGTAFIDFDGDGGLITDGSITMARFVEVTVDLPTRISTPVPGGKCFDLVMGALDMTPPPSGWTCFPWYYDDDDDCDCDCGVIDEDCADSTLAITNCQDGQTCDAATGGCTGIPTGWTCAGAEFGGGVGNGCDCDCGAHDPDCDLAPAENVDTCLSGEACNGYDHCVPIAWTCDDNYYDEDGDYCECGCGVVDPDCLSSMKISCDSCNSTGSCSALVCTDANSTINATNNAVCN